MRALSSRQAARCETAENKTCRCRCKGALHGAHRKEDADREFFEQLPQDDPHHVRSLEEKKRRAKIQRREAKSPMQGTLWQEL